MVCIECKSSLVFILAGFKYDYLHILFSLSQTRPAPNRNYIQCPVCRNRVYENALLKLHNDWKCDCPSVAAPKSLDVEISDRKWENELITLLETVKVGGKPVRINIFHLNNLKSNYYLD